jgi:hypothetical protein
MALSWGTIRIFASRTDWYQLSPLDFTQLQPEVITQENIWGFGQVVALGLLLLPFISFSGAFLFPSHLSTPFPTWSCF